MYYYADPIAYIETTPRFSTYRPQTLPPPTLPPYSPPPPTPPPYSPPPTESPTIIETKVNEVTPLTKIQCGTRANSADKVVTSLIIGGNEAGRKDFPWLVAQFHRTRHFICGGSLVSSRIIVSAAHCIHEKEATDMISAYDTTYYLGKYDISKLMEDGYESSDVERFELHPKWDPRDNRYDSDIGIAVLTRTIKFSNYIRPICIWTGSPGYSDMIGKKGLIAGSMELF